MFGSVVLDVAIGIVYLYAIVALMCAAVRECIEAALKTRAAYLERGIREVLHDVDGTAVRDAGGQPVPGGKTFTEMLYNHPLINSLFCRDYVRSEWDKVPGLLAKGHNLPSYIPSRNFALAVMEILAPSDDVTGAAKSNPFSEAQGPVGKALNTLVGTAQGDVEAAIANVERWYDDAMDRVSSQYRRVTQLFLFIIGFATAAAINIDTLEIARTLYADSGKRAALVELSSHASVQAASVGSTASTALGDREKELLSSGLPIGWEGKGWHVSDNADAWRKHIFAVLGWLITGLAATLGAPFWFDTLNRLTNLRTSLKPAKGGQA